MSEMNAAVVGSATQKEIQMEIEGRIKKGWKSAKYKIIRWCSIISFFGIWQIFGILNRQHKFFNPVFLPTPSDILKVGYDMVESGIMMQHLLSSLGRILLGFGVGTAVAVILGIIITRSELMESIVDPVLSLIGPIPAFAFLPLFIIWFGVGEFPKVVLIAFATFLPILTYTVDGLKSVHPTLIRSALSLGASEFDIFTKVILKSALPNIFTGMRVSLGLTFSALVVAEMMGADKGLGFIIVDARNWFKTANMFLAAAMIGILYSVFDLGLRSLAKALFKWKRGGMKDAVES